MAIVSYLDNGEITGVYTGHVDITQIPQYIEVEDELAPKILQESYAYRVVNGNVEYTPPAAVIHRKRFDDSVLVAGVVIDEVCYATNATALAFLAASLATSKPRAIVHKKEGDVVVSIDAELAEAIVDAAFNFVTDALAK